MRTFFSTKAIEQAKRSIRLPTLVGDLDANGIPASSDPGDYPGPLRMWEMPDPAGRYSIGVKVGFHKSFAFVNRMRASGYGDDVDSQAAIYVAELGPIHFAHKLAALGKVFNMALMCIEYNMIDTCANTVRFECQYPNLYRWRHLDSDNALSNKWHWFTTLSSKSRLFCAGQKWLESGLWKIRSENCLRDIDTVVIGDDDETSPNAGQELMAGMIALYCGHEVDVLEKSARESDRSTHA